MTLVSRFATFSSPYHGAAGGNARDPTACFSQRRFAEYSARVDRETELRRAAGCWDSDDEQHEQVGEAEGESSSHESKAACFGHDGSRTTF
jgi:hypothetical protein